ncbi:hypothetical protein H5410_056515 [Solanum commersonii]|uniref:Uncharacterized protein n=1 Tax=Solanum commersonii TaxID=4109 RepID=A0A9J5WLY1_SOLCO|nr:hypothetical protein H5410_056515 [Solanum commersonii]
MDLLVIWIFDVIFAKIFMDISQDLSFYAGWSQRANRPIFKVKLSPKRVNPAFCRFSCAIVHGCYGDLDFQCHFYYNYSWTSVKSLVIESIGPDEKIGLLSMSNKPQNRFSTSFLPKVFMDVHQDLSYGFDWSGWINHSFFMVK